MTDPRLLNQDTRIRAVIAGEFSDNVLTDGDVKFLRVALFHLIKDKVKERRKLKAG